jgi:hypothetical protein
MEEIQLGDDVLLKDMLAYDTIWRVTFIEGNKIYCLSYDENRSCHETAIIDRSLLKKERKPILGKRQE